MLFVNELLCTFRLTNRILQSTMLVDRNVSVFIKKRSNLMDRTKLLKLFARSAPAKGMPSYEGDGGGMGGGYNS